MVGTGQALQPVSFRVVSAGFPVQGASVSFATLIVRPQKDEPVVWLGDGTLAHAPAPVILASTQNTVLSDGNGVASLTPSTAGFAGPLIFQGTAFVGASSSTFLLESLAGMPGGFVMNRRSQER